MAITSSGLYGLTLEKFFQASGSALSLESETNVKVLMLLDSYTHNYDTHDFVDDLVLGTNEVSGTGYTTGGNTLTATELTLASGVLSYDAADVSWTGSTITNAMAAVGYLTTGADATTAQELVFLSDFVTAASSSNGTFTIQWNASGIWTLDYTPGA